MRKIIDKKTTQTGRIYALQMREKNWDVLWQDSYTWKYISNGKKITEARARELFALVTLQ